MSDQSKLIPFPITRNQRIRNERGPGYVPCMVSSRWLQFDRVVDYVDPEGKEYVMVNLMTLDKNERPYKICELVLTRQDLMNALQWIQPKAE